LQQLVATSTPADLTRLLLLLGANLSPQQLSTPLLPLLLLLPAKVRSDLLTCRSCAVRLLRSSLW
jgi:hypothetical protein